MFLWLWLKGAYDVLMRISIPLLLAIVACAVLAVPTAWKLAVTSGKLKKSEAAVVKLDKANSSLKSDLATCNANVDDLSTSLEIQNKAVDALKAESDARTKRAQAAITEAQKQARGFKAKIAKLEAAKPMPDQCVSARNLIIQTLSESR